MRLVVALSALTMIAPPQSAHAQSSPEREVLAAEEARRLAVATGDVSALDRLMTSDYTVVTIAGDLLFKSGELALSKTGRRTQQQPKETDLRVRLYGHAAVVTGLSWRKDIRNGTPSELQYRFMNVWVKRDDRWQVAARHATAITDAMPSVATRRPSDAVAAPVNIVRPAEQFGAAEEAVFAAFRVAQNALFSADVGTLSQYLTDDWSITIPTGQVRDKRSVLVSLVPRVPPRLMDEIRIRMYGDVAILTHRTVSAEGTTHRTTFVSVKQDGRWKQAANQQTTIAPAGSR